MKETIVKNPTWWKRRSRLEKLLLHLLFLVFIIGLALLISLIVISCKNSSSSELCVTSGCIKTASQILDRMNASADPCADFYEFACGNFIKSTAIPKDKTSVNSFSIINDKVLQQLRDVLEEPPIDSESRSFLLAKKFYSTCLNESYIEDQGLTPMRNILAVLDGWPVLEGDKWREDEFDWKTLLYKIKNIGLGSELIISMDIIEDVKNNTKYVLQLSQITSEAEREILLKDFKDKVLKAYYEYMVNIAVSFGAYRTFAEREMFSVLEFQRSLANISMASEELRNATLLYNPMTIEQLQKKYPSIPWLQYINNLLYPTIQLTKDEVIIVQTPSYFEKLEKVLQETPKRAIANYMIWEIMKDFNINMPEQQRKLQLKYRSAAYGITEDEPRWQQCVQRTYAHFNLAISALFVRKYFDPDAKRKALAMVEDIQETFLDILKHLDWMDETTRRLAIDKAKDMDVHIAYPNELLDDKKLNKFYEKLTVNDSFLESEILWRQFSWDLNWSYLRKPVNKTMWITHGSAATVNAFYSFTENSISFPAGILQDVFFSNDRPNYINYGSIGSIIGHEITHGFDDQGRQYNQEGVVVNWWTPETEKSFLSKAQCIIDQYDNFVVPEINEHLNGYNSQGENIADNGGLKEAYLAYRRYQSRRGEEPQLPGLPYTSRQLFWLSAAGTWCSVDRPDYLQMQIYDVHSPTKFRVIGPMSNSQEFSEDWGCEIGSYMNPEKKCQNIADNGGLKEAYLAYRRYQARRGEEPQLPGLPYTSRQLFWLSAAGTWCSVDRPDYLQMQIYDVHSPTKFRVIGPMSNSQEFSEDWGCEIGSKMNPEKKCQVW